MGTPYEDIARCAQVIFPQSTSVCIFDADLRIIYAHECCATQQELQSLRGAFADRQAAIKNGLILARRRYEVHRFHPPLIYGRAVIDTEPEEGPGIAICNSVENVYAVVTFQPPETTARMAPLLKHFCEQHLRPTASQDA